jgi:hypothetical protein
MLGADDKKHKIDTKYPGIISGIFLCICEILPEISPL